MTKRQSDAGHPRDVPGNTMQSQVAHDEFVFQLGQAWAKCVRAFAQLEADGLYVKRVSIKGTWSTNTDMLVIITAAGPEGPLVAFHNVDDVFGLWRGLGNRMRNGSLKWRDDEYAK